MAQFDIEELNHHYHVSLELLEDLVEHSHRQSQE
jgi:hypothetical protein